jgi:hypothetical protein
MEKYNKNIEGGLGLIPPTLKPRDYATTALKRPTVKSKMLHNVIP